MTENGSCWGRTIYRQFNESELNRRGKGKGETERKEKNSRNTGQERKKVNREAMVIGASRSGVIPRIWALLQHFEKQASETLLEC